MAAATELVQRLIPDRLYDRLSYQRHSSRGRGASNEHQIIDGKVIRHHSEQVIGGPFAGMRYTEDFVGMTTNGAAKIVGAYEHEILAAVDRVIAAPTMRRFVDIGCAEGYYAVGVARRRPDVSVLAFDISPPARHMCRRLARLNGCERNVAVRAEATVEFLACLSSDCVVFSDCEGAELHLLDPARAASLRCLPLIVELHDFVNPTISGVIRERFRSTHTIEQYETQPRDVAHYPGLSFLPPAERELAVQEGRPAPMSWLVLEPRDA
jgi:hypothetical protein